MEKKPWHSPTLIALVKGQPEEAVLQACKTPAMVGPYMSANSCEVVTATPCSLVTSS